MKITATIGMLAVATALQAREGAPAASRMVTVFVAARVSMNGNYLIGAEVLASSLLRTAGVEIQWREGEPSRTADGSIQPIVIDLVADDPAAPRKALAFALPYEGSHIRILTARIVEPDARRALLLGYVLAHEITHILQGVARHSAEGIMKPYWRYGDYADMRAGRLRFAAEDIELIRDGTDARLSSRLIASARP